ncbi:MAG: hypothetical protein HYS86_05055 [Candidatus Chisholmbacteria bacterium]|nr:hypothetical protein [Candidatus Chisholmbacteria bacterium]
MNRHLPITPLTSKISTSLIRKAAVGLLLGLFTLLVSTLNPTPSYAATGVGITEQLIDRYFAITIECENQPKISFECLTRAAVDNIENETMGAIAGTTTNAIAGGLLPGTTLLIASLYQQQPASTAQYLAYLHHTYTPQAYAQGAGYAALSPVQKVWSAFLNITYFFFVLIFVVTGLMIMFRTQINPQTVISLQNALPRLVVTLVLVTFSFAIAGFLIDLMYFLTVLAIQILGASGLVDSGLTQDIILNHNFLELWWYDILGGVGFLRTMIELGPSSTPQQLTGTLAGALAALVVEMFGQTQNVILAGVLRFGFKLLAIFLSVVLLITLFRVFFQLLMAFISIVIMVIFSPVLLLFNALPGSNAFSNWIKNLFANVLIFPAVAVFIVIAGALAGAERFGGTPPNFSATSGFVPPLLGFKNIPIGAVQGLTAFGLLLMLPSVIQMIAHPCPDPTTATKKSRPQTRTDP